MSMNNTLIDMSGYTVHSLLGKGGMAEVYLATQDSLRRKVAVKVLLNTDDDSFIQRFINEGHVVASLNHPAIITIYDINQLHDGRYYLAMEFISGGDLTQYKGQMFEPARALNITKQIAEGLSVLHDQGLIHRDIKPANILFRSSDSVVITDFGIAKSMTIDNELTHAGIAVGSPAYSSPEQAQCQPLDQRTDIYSLGVILLEMLTGVNCFRGSSYTQTVMNHVQMDIPALPAHLRVYQPLLDKMLAKNPDDRFSNCQQLVSALNHLINNSNTLAAKPQPKQSAAITLLSFNHLKGYAAVAIVFLAIVLAFAWPKMMVKIKTARYLSQAEHRLAEGKLLLPANDNADYFYHQALLVSPNNSDAIQGLQKVTAARIAKLMVLAEQSMAKNQLTTPENDNAEFYLRQVLALAPNDQKALAGLHRLVEIYIALAKDAHDQGEYQSGLRLIKSGLAIEPTNDILLKLLDANKQQPTGSSKEPTKKSGRNKRSSSPLQRFWNKLW